MFWLLKFPWVDNAWYKVLLLSSTINSATKCILYNPTYHSFRIWNLSNACPKVYSTRMAQYYIQIIFSFFTLGYIDRSEASPQDEIKICPQPPETRSYYRGNNNFNKHHLKTRSKYVLNLQKRGLITEVIITLISITSRRDQNMSSTSRNEDLSQRLQ